MTEAVGGNLFIRFVRHEGAFKPEFRARQRFPEIFPTTRLKSNICGGDDGVCNDGHKL